MLIALLSITTVVLVARQGAANEVRAFMNRGGASNSTGLVDGLEGYFQTHGNWEGAGGLLLPQGQGQGLGRARNPDAPESQFILADANANILINTQDPDANGRLNLLERGSAIPLQVGGETVGFLVVVGEPGNSREQGSQLISRLNNAAQVAAIVAGVLSLILAWFLAWRLMRPVNELTRAAEKLGKGDLSERVQVHGKDELAVLGHSFNQMANSLQHAEESRRAMTADIAHELRNPLAVQRANLEALQDGIYPLTETNLAPVIEQNYLLTRLVEDLRTLALADSGHLELDLIKIDTVDLTRRMVDRYQPRARELDISIALAPGEKTNGSDYEIIGDPIRLEQILGNLIENALRYTPAGGSIKLRITASGKEVQTTIRDDGPGIPEDLLPHIFERFFRGEQSRSRSDGGSGLGLAISRQLAEAQGGSLTARITPLGEPN